MTSITEIKDKLLRIHRSGKYATLSPANLLQTHTQLTSILTLHQTLLSAVELYDLYELQFYVSLMMSEDAIALKYMNLIIDRFGNNNSQRITILKTVYLNATEGAQSASYYVREKLKENQDQLRIMRTNIGLLKQQKEPTEYIEALVSFLDRQPLDAQCWYELSEQYCQLGNYDKALHCLKEVLMLQPYAYNVMYKVGEVSLASLKQAAASATFQTPKTLDKVYGVAKDGRSNFLRSIELCDNYAKAWIGLYVMTLDGYSLNEKLSSRGNVLKSHRSLEGNIEAYLAKNAALHSMAQKKLLELSYDKDLPQEVLAAIAAALS
ncbi:hypothetical protein BABINDRAFT_160779 [Babjeviella inositovora NRRL Y-12698]|uniref:ER membrane protein complex subunit 2 n=1 Tax=Babjeviella inositovora NRRL Y-12698 TaxID=984486 RepID=A0A1E3QS31_9ASCO|nr:uncharacterized protein BABINDRAFT_160779 [Babjeviella inositovora NRRL Y-12698]ODQ80505.1 hypothetical protein BABINDRAFT_160779 [Babjeviella inositovora NRRL Y-12698]